MSESKSKPKRKLFQFSLMGVLVLMFIAALGTVIYRDYVLRWPDMEELKWSDGFTFRHQIDETGEVSTSIAHGKTVATDKYDRVFYEGNFWNGLPSGNWTVFHPNGRVALRATTDSYVSRGSWNAWHATGWKSAQLSFGKPRVRFTKFFPSAEFEEGSIGQLLGEEEPTSNREGAAKTFWSNGQVRSEGQFVSNEHHGKWTFWNKQGDLVATGAYRRGVRHGKWKELVNDKTTDVVYLDGVRVVDISILLKNVKHDLRSSNATSVDRAFRTLGVLGEHGVSTLVEQLEAPSPENAIRSLIQLRAIGSDAKRALSAIESLIHNSDTLVQTHARIAVAQIDPSQFDAQLEQVRRLIPNESGRKQRQILSTTATLGWSLLPECKKLVASESQTDRMVALNLLNTLIVDGHVEELRFDAGTQREFFELLKTAMAHDDSDTAELATFVMENWRYHLSPPARAYPTIPVVG